MDTNTDDSNAVVRRGMGDGMVQQGQVDWTRLGGSMVSWTIEYLVRISNGGVEGITTTAAQVMLGELKLSAEGERRLQDAVSRLSAVSSSINKFLWFGFGVKHIIRTFAESEQGENCIAVCAALQEMYSTHEAAKIVQELARLRNAPPRMMPSLRQWVSLVEVCGGALAATDFGALLHTISKLFYPPNQSEACCRAHPKDIANAISGLIAVSNGSQETMQLLGGADAGWIAAFAIWMLDLPVQIKTPSGEILYSSCREDWREPRLTVIRGDPSKISLQLTKRSFIIPSGEILLRGGDYGQIGNTLSYGRVHWKSLLGDTFGNPALELTKGAIAPSFGSILGCAARIFTGFLSQEPGVPEDHRYRQDCEYIGPLSHGRGFINSIRQWLPEIQGSTLLMDASERCVVLEFPIAIATYEQHMVIIQETCSCATCKNSRNPEANLVVASNGKCCLIYLAEAIIELIQALAHIHLETDVLPTRSGVESFYWRHWAPRREPGSFVYKKNIRGQHRAKIIRSNLNAAACIFGGRERSGSANTTTAFTSHGCYFYLDILSQFSADQEHCRLVHVGPGHIEFHEKQFNLIASLETGGKHPVGPEYDATVSEPCQAKLVSKLEDSASADLTAQLLLEEHEEHAPKSLDVAFKFSTGKGHFTIPPNKLLAIIQTGTTAKDCRGWECGPLPAFNVIPVLGDGRILHSGCSNPAQDRVPFVVNVQGSVIAQLMLLGQHHVLTPPNKAMELRRNFLQEKECLRCLIMDAINNRRGRRPDISQVLCIITRL